jgi:hypothetical protein
MNHPIYIDKMQILPNKFGFNLMMGSSLSADGKSLFEDFIFGMSPQHLKAMSQILQSQIIVYEKTFGEIKLNPQIQEEVEKTKIGFAPPENQKGGEENVLKN